MTEEEPKPEDFMRIGGSPEPGITLRQVLRGDTGIINRIAWSSCGRFIAAPTKKGTIYVWEIERNKTVAALKHLQVEPVSRLSRREEVMMDVQQAITQRRTAFEAALVRVKGLLQDQGREKAPSCFISYSWGVPEHERWVVQFAKDLRNAGIDVLLDRWHSPPGSDLGRYMDQIMKSDFVAVVGTPQLLKKYEMQASDPVVATELSLINVRLQKPSVYGQTVIPLLLDGDDRSSFIPMLQTLVRVDFKQSAFYFRQLFDLIWRMYSLPFGNPLLDELRESMTSQERS